MSDDDSKAGCGCLLIPIIIGLGWLLIRLIIWIASLPGRICDACSAYEQWPFPWSWLGFYYDHVIVGFLKLPITMLRLCDSCIVDGWHVQLLGFSMNTVLWGVAFSLVYSYYDHYDLPVVWRALAVLLVIPFLLTVLVALVMAVVALAGGVVA